ncbi:MAG: hypothetical protein JWP91_3806 [Fibrobacteres bacterium]|nr:hypothetical protein [Fibrobacterota bacterium]
MSLYIAIHLPFFGKKLEINPKNGQREGKVEYIFISDAKDHSGLLKQNPADSVDPEPADTPNRLKTPNLFVIERTLKWN